ncbi:MAG: DUF4870 domain-containing protein [Dermatophilaceae bacterium]
MSQYGQDPAYQPPTPYQSPGPISGMSAEDRNLGTIAHVTPLVLMLISGGLAGFIGSLVVYLYAKDRGAAARQYAAGALNAQILVCIGAAISYVLMLVLIGFITLPLVILFGLVVHILGAVKANKGEPFSPPLTPSFVS